MKAYAQLQQEIDKVQEGLDALPPDRNILKNLKLNSAVDVGPFISQILQYALVLGGLILLVMLITAGFTILTSAGDPKKVDAGKARLTHAAVGFLILFTTYWLAQILQVVFNLPILSL